MATAPPELTVKLKVDTTGALEQSRAKIVSYTAETEAIAGRAQTVERAKTSAKLEAQNTLALQKQRLAWERHLNSIAIAEEKARIKSLKGQESWSARMTKSLNGISFAIKGMAAAWATATITSAIKNSVQLAGGMRDLASGVQLSTQQYFALTSALRDAGVQAEKIDPIFTRLNDLISGGATPAQQTILDRLGINATGMSNVQLMDTLLGKINSRMITQSELGELVGNRIVPAWNRLANEINNVNEANSKYSFPLSDKEVEILDRAASKWERILTLSSLYFAKAITSPALSGLGGGLAAGAAAQAQAIHDQLDALLKQERALAEFLRNGPPAIGEQTITTPQPRGGGANTPPNRVPVDANGRPIRQRRAQADRSFILPTISRELPTITRETDEWNQELTDSLTLAEEIAGRIALFASSDTWQVAQAGAQAFNNIMSLQAQLVQGEVEALQMLMQMENERWDERERRAQESGTATSAAFRNEAREHERIEKQRQKKLRQLQSKGWEQNRISRIGETVMLTAQSVMNAFATAKNPILAAILSGIYTATGAAQVGIISSQKNPYNSYAFGGYVPGQSLGDDTMINVTGGEFVTTREATRNNRAALEYANRGGILRPEGASGGITVIIQGDIVGDDAYVENRLIPKLQKAIDRGYKLQTN